MTFELSFHLEGVTLEGHASYACLATSYAALVLLARFLAAICRGRGEGQGTDRFGGLVGGISLSIRTAPKSESVEKGDSKHLRVPSVR